MKKICVLITLNTLGNAFSASTNLEIYNNLDIPVHIALVKNKQKNASMEFQEIVPGTRFNKEIKTNIPTETVVVLKQISIGPHQIDAFTLNYDHDQTVCLKLHKTHEANLMIIPQSPVPGISSKSFGGLSLEHNISHKQILKTTIDYEPQQAILEPAMQQSVINSPDTQAPEIKLSEKIEKHVQQPNGQLQVPINSNNRVALQVIDHNESLTEQKDILTFVSLGQETESHL